MSDEPPLEPSDSVSLLYYIEARFRERDKAHQACHAELERRLQILNITQEETRRRDAQFYSKEMHDAYAARVQDELKDVRKDIDNKTKPTYWWAAGLGALVVTFGGVWYLSDVIARLDIAQKHVIDELADHNKQMDQFQTSLDHLAKQLGQKPR